MILPLARAKRAKQPSPPDDAALLQEARRDPDAIATLYERYMPNVYRYVLSRVGNVQDAEDLTTQTFMSVLNSIGTYKADSQFLTWVLGIARHKIADFFRRKKPAISLEHAGHLQAHFAPIEDAVHQTLQLERVVACLGNISPDRAEAITLRIFGGLNVSEIAQLMDRSDDAVYALLSRGMRDLRQRLYADNE